MTLAAADTNTALSLQTLSDHIARLPPLPSLASEMLDGLTEEDMDPGLLARRIVLDQTLALRALRIANSPFYGLPGRIDSIAEAVVVLGSRAIRSLIISAATVNTLSGLRAEAGIDTRKFWRHSIGSAVAARHLARLAGQNPDAAFTAGLLHDIGQIVLALAFPERYGAVRAQHVAHGGQLVALEKQLLGFTHADAGALLAARWGLPAVIGDAIAAHHQPEQSEAGSLASIAHIGSVIAHALALSGDPEEMVPALSDTAWKRLGIEWSALPTALARIEEEFDGTMTALLG